ncbi:MAG TPA: tetratricopeptide repeat protein [Candidatus Limnocylindria bacterium]|jgi:tetratricopeptide (TPR) repeat protein|nr:tetratricopeptide repeat protein [Candidatus Limnocylindria bacterium]
MNPHYQRGVLLWEQGRHALAESEFRAALGQNPNDASCHAMLALCLGELERYDEGRLEAAQAIQLEPDFAGAHYAMSSLSHDAGWPVEAMTAIQEAIRLDPTDPDYHAQLAVLYIHQKEWKKALAAAEAGLEFDPEHVDCNNMRSLALMKLSRPAEAGAGLDASLARRPENSATHANRGWAYLESNEPEKALEHFKEALRLDPENDWARSGIVTALKARYFIYGLMLRYFLWMAKLKGKYQFAIIIGGYFGNRFLAQLSHSKPALAPWLLPVRLLYVAFALLTWMADPLFNLILRLNRFGRLVLTPRQITASNWVGACLGLALISIVLIFVKPVSVVGLAGAMVFGFISIPVSAIFNCAPGWTRWTMIAFTAAMGGVGLILIFQQIAELWPPSQTGMGALEFPDLFSIFTGFVVASFWIANILIAIRPRRASADE